MRDDFVKPLRQLADLECIEDTTIDERPFHAVLGDQQIVGMDGAAFAPDTCPVHAARKWLEALGVDDEIAEAPTDGRDFSGGLLP